jgi:hypothetical protein
MEPMSTIVEMLAAQRSARMGAWTLVENALLGLVATVVLMVLIWAATERARIHQIARDESRHCMTAHSRRLGIWRVLLDALRALPRSHRLHLALGAVGGCV